jgi:hypothetical protein
MEAGASKCAKNGLTLTQHFYRKWAERHHQSILLTAKIPTGTMPLEIVGGQHRKNNAIIKGIV